MNKRQAIEKLQKLKDRGEPLAQTRRGSEDFEKWKRDTEVAIERIFGQETRHFKDFKNVRYSLGIMTNSTPDSAFERAYQSGMKSALTIIDSFIDEVNEYWEEDDEPEEILEISPIDNIELIIEKFHRVARQLRSRYADRSTLEIEDEYDVQDLFHSLLQIYFDDIRPEEYTPSYAGSASRVDFLLKTEKIIIEIKKTRKGLEAKEVGEQLIIDSQRYQSHPDCNQLICFVYDPEGRISNPSGLENDLTKEINNVPVTVFIRPKH